MQPLPPETMPAVSHVTFSIFNLAIPNIAVWLAVITGFAVAAWTRLPRAFEPSEQHETGDPR
jgi:hypothetical protein